MHHSPLKDRVDIERSLPGRDNVGCMIVSFGENETAEIVFQSEKSSQPHEIIFPSISLLKDGEVRKRLRQAGWRGNRNDSVYIVIPSEETLLSIEAFPTTRDEEIRSIAHAKYEAMTELNSEEDLLSFSVLEQGENNVRCALCIFRKERIVKVYESVAKLGFKNVSFIIDVFPDVFLNNVHSNNEYSGLINFDPETGKVVVKGIRFLDSKIRDVRQRIYFQKQLDENFLTSLPSRIFPEVDSSILSKTLPWPKISASKSSVETLKGYIGLYFKGKLNSFHLQFDEWTLLQRKRTLKRLSKRALILVASLYALFLLLCGAASIYQNSQFERLVLLKQEQSPAANAAIELKTEIEMLKARQDPGSNVLEVLRLINNALPKTFTLTRYSFRRSESIVLSGSAPSDEAVYDFGDEIKKNPLFIHAKTPFVRKNTAGVVSWDIQIPFKQEGMNEF